MHQPLDPRSSRVTGDPHAATPFAGAEGGRALARLRYGFLAAAVILGAVQYWAHRDTMYPDGLSYLEIAEAYLARDWANALNAYWSPLYSWVIAAALWLLRPSPDSTFALLHGVDFALYLGAVLAFDFFLRRLTAHEDPHAAPAAWVWRLFAYCLFLWAVIGLPLPATTTPDTLVAALVFWAAGLMVRWREAGLTLGRHALLGAVLGLAYLAKAALLPIGVVALSAALWMSRRSRKRVTLAATAIASFALVVAPFAIALSLDKGRITFGDTGALNYAWYVNRVPGMHVHWQGDDTRPAAHPMRLVVESPRVYEFAEPVAGTYPPWYDPSYWNEGLTPRFDLVQQLQAVYEGLTVYNDLLLPFVIAFLALAYVIGPARTARALRHNAAITVFGAAGVLLYILVRVEARFLMPFLPLLLLGAFGALRTQRWPSPRILDGMLLALSAAALLPVLSQTAGGIGHAVGGDGNVHQEIAEAVRAAGVEEDDRIAVVGRGIDAYWAYLAGVRIIAEVAESDEGLFWSDADARRRALQAFDQAGARAVIGVPRDTAAALDEWRPLAAGYALLWLEETEAAPEDGG